MQPPLMLANQVIRGNIVINSKPKSALVERMGCDSAALARQLYAVAEGNFRNILSSSWLYLNKDDRNIASVAVFFTCDTGNDYWQLPIATKKLAKAARLLSPKADFLRSNVTLRGNTPLSKEFQGESR